MKKFLMLVLLLGMVFPKPVLASVGCVEPSSGGYAFMFGMLIFLVTYIVWWLVSFKLKPRLSIFKILVLSIVFSLSMILMAILINSAGALIGWRFNYIVFMVLLSALVYPINWLISKRFTSLKNNNLLIVNAVIVLILAVIWFGFGIEISIIFSKIYWWIYAGTCRGMQGG